MFALILITLTVLFITAYIFINSKKGKRFVRNQIQKYLTQKLKTNFSIDAIDYTLPNEIKLSKLFIATPTNDSLLYAGELNIKISLLRLLKGETEIKQIELKDAKLHINRKQFDSTYNFQFIIEAFAGNKDSTSIKDTAELKFNLHRVLLKNVIANINDEFGGKTMHTKVGHLDLTFNKFQLSKLNFDIQHLYVDGITFNQNNYSLPDSNTKIRNSKEFGTLNADIIDLKNAIISIHNHTTGFEYYQNISHTKLEKMSISMIDHHMEMKSLFLTGSNIDLKTKKSKTNSVNITDSNKISWIVEINKIDLNNNIIKTSDNSSSPNQFDISNLNAQEISLQANKLYYSTDSTNVSIQNFHFIDHSGFQIDTAHANIVFTSHQTTASELYIKTPNTLIQHYIHLSYSNLKSIKLHAAQTSLNINLSNSVLSIDDLFKIAPSLTSNTSLQKFKYAKIYINSILNGSLQQLNIHQLEITTSNQSSISLAGRINHITQPKNIQFDINLLPSQIFRIDILPFIVINKESNVHIPNKISIDGSAKGSLNKLMAHINIEGDKLLINADTKLTHFDNIEKLEFECAIHASSFQRELLFAFIPKNKIPKNIELPKNIECIGFANGTMNKIQYNFALDGSYGKLSSNGYINKFKVANDATYKIAIHGDQFLLGKFLMKDSILDAITFNGTIQGKSFDIQKMKSTLFLNIDAIELNKYTYHQIQLQAKADGGHLKSWGNTNDPNLRMQYTFITDNLSNPRNVNFNARIDTLRSKELFSTKDEFQLSTTLAINASNITLDNLNAILEMDSTIITANNKTFQLDSTIIIAKTNSNEKKLIVTSDFLTLNAKGEFSYDLLYPSLLQHLNYYYPFSSTPLPNSNSQNIVFSGQLTEHPLMGYILPNTFHFQPISFEGYYNSMKEDSGIYLKILAPMIDYKESKITKSSIELKTNGNELNLNTNIELINAANNELEQVALNAQLSNDSLDINLSSKNKDGSNRYSSGATILSKLNTYTAHFKENIVLNNQRWQINPMNLIYFSPSGFYLSNVELSSNNSRVSIKSEKNIVNSPIHIELDNFSIHDIIAVMNQDSNIASGNLHGKFVVSEFKNTIPAFEGNLNIDQFILKQQPIGDIQLTAKKVDNQTIFGQASLKGNGNNIFIDGNYFLNNSEKQFDAALLIDNLNIASFEKISNGYISNTSGSINGKIQIGGKFSSPVWNGIVNFKEPSFHLNELGTSYKINNQSVVLKYPNILLNQFKIIDSANHTLSIDGTITSNTVSNYNLDLGIHSKDFIVVNTNRSTNDYIYGFAGINSDLSIKGNTNHPNIQGQLSLNDQTDATILIPQQSANKDKAISVIRFIDRDTFELPEKILFTPLDSVSQKIKTVLNYNVNVDLSKNASLTVIIDPITGDKLKVSGEAKLNVGVDAGGNILLAGNYDLAKGHYILHYQFLQRQFDLLPQSTILFSGNPFDAQLDIHAEYIANTSAIDLVGNELGDADSRTVNTFNQKIPFKVLLFIKGTLKKLDISFDIKLPEENSGLSNTIITTVENKLTQLRADPSAINKQVFSLLVLNRFVGEQSSDFFKGNGGSIEVMARESVSKFLSAALDQIAADLIKGVDIDLNLNSYKDYRSGITQQRTDLNIGITKRFMDDRLSISLGKDFGVEGDDKSGKTRGSTNSAYFPNAIVNYKLSKDGKYAVRAYSKNKFEVILDGYVVESGLSFLVTMDYEKFSELFEKKPAQN